MDYLPYGEFLGSRNLTGIQQDATKFHFTGKECDFESGYDYFGARYYNNKLGLWNSVDSLKDKYPGWSPFNYTLGNPILLTDSDGSVVRDENGKIIFNPVGNPIPVKHEADDSKAEILFQPGYMTADDGSKIDIFKNLSNDKRYDTNCHGVTFADGEYWVNPDKVDNILKGDNYQEITPPQKVI